MRTVKGQYASVVVALCELFAVPPVKRLTYKELGDVLGAGPEAVKTWARRGVPPKFQLRVLQLAEGKGADFSGRAKNLLEGVKNRSRMPQDERTFSEQRNRHTKEGRGPDYAGDFAPRLIDMESATAKICTALKEDLERSRALILLDKASNKQEHLRHQELVWSLKDLARRLHRMGFDMRNLFHVTDDLAREVGLPVREYPPDSP